MCITSCYWMYVRPIPEEGQPELPKEGFGYISRGAGSLEPANYRSCVFYSSDEKSEYFDSMWRAGKAMSIMATLIGFVVMCAVMCTCCVAYELRTFDSLFWTCMICFVCQALTFLSWGSDLCDEYECTWSQGTGMNITASMLWIWAANMIKSFPEALPPRGRGRRKQPVYEDDASDAFYTDDSPYMDRNGNYDDYDENSEYVDFQNDENRGYLDDRSYDTDGYTKQQDDEYTYDSGYPQEQPQDYLDNGTYADDGTYGGQEGYDQQSGYDQSWADQSGYDQQYDDGNGGKVQPYGDGTDWSQDQGEFNADEDNNYFHQSPADLSASQGDLSREEQAFIGENDAAPDDYYADEYSDDQYSQGYTDDYGRSK